uniref:Transmembrane protein n=1 Tax=Fagus sylvatica TaxID=28930 RepID=A0A2N9FD65_FAGSY
MLILTCKFVHRPPTRIASVIVAELMLGCGLWMVVGFGLIWRHGQGWGVWCKGGRRIGKEGGCNVGLVNGC